MKIVKKTLESIPFDLVYAEGKDSKETIAQIAIHSTWVLPQALAYLGRLKAIKNGDKFDAVLTVKEHLKDHSSPDWFKGLIMYLKSNPRGTVLGKKYAATNGLMLPYGALVPLFLAGFKKYQNIPYSSWDNFKSVTDSDLYDAMTCTVPKIKADILELRQQACTVQGGATAGDVLNPVKATMVRPTIDTEFNELPRLAKVMLLQLWLAHPTYRHEYMVLNPSNWDEMPKPLIDSELLSKPVEEKEAWDA